VQERRRFERKVKSRFFTKQREMASRWVVMLGCSDGVEAHQHKCLGDRASYHSISIFSYCQALDGLKMEYVTIL
jgi:hypothetical protein